MSKRSREIGVLGRLFGQVAFWQAMGFLALIAFVWARETLDLPAVLYGAPESPPDWLGASIVTAGIVVIGFIVVAHTYLQQQRILRGFIRVCSYCRKVHVERTMWEPIELFISERTLAEFTHGICPDCMKRVSSELDDQRGRTDGKPAAPPAPDTPIPPP